MIKPDFRIYKIETTRYWQEDIARKAGRIFDVYVFDAVRCVNCCELTPSYELWYVGPTWKGGEILDDEEQDQIQREILHMDIVAGVADNDPVAYVHATDVDVDRCERLEIDDEEWSKLLKHHDNPDDAWREALDRTMEYCRCNGWLY